MSPLQRCGFKAGEFIVYPAHGVGQIFGIEEQEVAGAALELIVINFKKAKMTLRIPTSKFANVGMRKLYDPLKIRQAHQALGQRSHAGRGIWSRLAQEYEAKINSGDVVAIAKVLRDLYRPMGSTEQSYSERQLYEVALDRLSREFAVVQHIPEDDAVREIEGLLFARPRSTKGITATS